VAHTGVASPERSLKFPEILADYRQFFGFDDLLCGR
jgi:hypothetical protein